MSSNISVSFQNGRVAETGGNVTGLSTQSDDIAGKRLELFRELIPSLRRVAILANVGNPFSVLELGEAQAAARALGLEVNALEIRRSERHWARLRRA
jgi:putative ABC transport system substrate-binding protein